MYVYIANSGGCLMTKIFSHLSPQYEAKRNLMRGGKYNGAYYYSQEIVENIIPNVKTNRNWITINVPGYGFDNSIVFIHSNIDPIGPYMWLRNYKNLVTLDVNTDLRAILFSFLFIFFE